MFSSNQILEVSGSLHGNELYSALKFGLDISERAGTFIRKAEPAICLWQVTSDGKYCIGYGYDKVPKGWQTFQFDFDLEIISKIIAKHLEKFPIEEGFGDGGYEKGFLMSVIDDSFAEEKNGVINPLYGILQFKPFTAFYAK